MRLRLSACSEALTLETQAQQADQGHTRHPHRMFPSTENWPFTADNREPSCRT